MKKENISEEKKSKNDTIVNVTQKKKRGRKKKIATEE